MTDKIYTIKEDVKCVSKNEIWIKAGDEVTLISIHNGVALVEDKNGLIYPTNKNNLK